MLFSMTGYGEGAVETDAMRVGFRLRSVNYRGLDISLKLPFDFMYMENDLRNALKARFMRGRIDVFCELEIRDPALRPPTPLDRARIMQLTDATQELHELGITGALDINTVITMPDISGTQRVGWRLPEALTDQVQDALSQAMDALEQSRLAEGAQLGDDLRSRLSVVREWSARVEALAGSRRDELRQAIVDRIRELAHDTNIDPARLDQEVVYYADRYDISEEITRLAAHAATMTDLLATGKRPLGKELEFMLQEQLREITTIGNKAKHRAIADCVVKLKTESEKMREQVQNLE